MLSTDGRHSAVPSTPASTRRADEPMRGATASGSSGQIRRGQTVQPGSPCRGGSGPSTGGGGGGGYRASPDTIIVMSAPPSSAGAGW